MKRFTISAVLLGFLGVSLLLARPALTDQESEKKTAEPTKLEELQKERIETLEKLMGIVTEAYKTGLCDLGFAKTQEELIDAKLEATDKPDERIALLEEQLKIAQDIFKFVDNAAKVGFGHFVQADALRAKAHCLAIEIKLLKERNKARSAK